MTSLWNGCQVYELSSLAPQNNSCLDMCLDSKILLKHPLVFGCNYLFNNISRVCPCSPGATAIPQPAHLKFCCAISVFLLETKYLHKHFFTFNKNKTHDNDADGGGSDGASN